MKFFYSLVFIFAFSYASNIKDNFWADIGFETGYYGYTEPKLMKVRGMANGFNFDLGYAYEGILKAEMQGRYFNTFGLYKGGTLNTGEANFKSEKVISLSADFILNTEIKLGLNSIFTNSSHRLYLQAGVGHWILFDVLYFVPRRQTYYYIPIEIEGENVINEKWALNYLFGYKYFLKGKHKTSTSKVGWSDDIKVSQKNGYGFKVMFGLVYNNDPQFSTFYNIVFDHWYVGDSPYARVTTNLGKTDYYLEPKNHTQLLSFQFGFRY